MVNAWIAHVKQFAAQHRMKYGDALKHPECRSSYHSGKRTGGMVMEYDANGDPKHKFNEDTSWVGPGGIPLDILSGKGFRRKRMGRGTTMHHPADTLFIHYDENGFMHPIRKDGTWSNIPGTI